MNRDLADYLESAAERLHEDQLRDRFAMAALPAIQTEASVGFFSVAEQAKQAYLMADAMMEARKPKKVASPPKEGVFR